MMLVVDLGNTRLKWAWWDGTALQPGGAIGHRGQDLAALLDAEWQPLPTPAACHVASVVPNERRAAFDAWVAARWALHPVHAVSRAQQAGVTSGYHDPAQLGVDRWLAMIGAWRRVGGAACVVDCGSAVTVDILDHQGRHLGGVIAPGLGLMADALQRGTALPALAGDSDALLGRDTGTALAAGALEALRGLVDRCHARAPEDARLVLTGGDAERLAAGIALPYDIIPDLVLEGLAGTLDGV